MGGEKRQIGGAGDVAHGAGIASSLPATDGGGTAGAAAHATIRIRPNLSGPAGAGDRHQRAGRPGDTTARLFAQKLTENLGQSFYIENMGGGGGNIAMGVAARVAPFEV